MQTPVWVVITGFFVGPAVIAALLAYPFNRSLNKQKAALDEAVQGKLDKQKADLDQAVQSSLNEQKADLDRAVQRMLNEQKAALDEAVQRRLNRHAAEIKYTFERRARLDEYIAKQREALLRSYILVFEDGAQASPEQLLELLRKADAGVMEPLRAFPGRDELRRETEVDIYEVHNFLWQAIPIDGQPLSPQTVQRLRERKDQFVSYCWQAIRALKQEQETREQD